MRRKREVQREQQPAKEQTSSYFSGELIVGDAGTEPVKEKPEKKSRRKKNSGKDLSGAEAPAEAEAPFPEFQPEFSIVRPEPEPELLPPPLLPQSARDRLMASARANARIFFMLLLVLLFHSIVSFHWMRLY